MPDDIIISELSNAPQIDDSAVFPLTQDNGGSPATFKGTMSQIAGKIGEGTTFANLHTTSKTLVGALNELKDGGGGSAEIIGTSSGSIATFNDGGNGIPLKSCEVEIVAQQAGSGTPSPSNPRAISGFDSVDVNVIGANLIDGYSIAQSLQAKGGTLNTTTKTISYSGQVAGNVGVIFTNFKPNTAYTFFVRANANSSSQNANMRFVYTNSSNLTFTNLPLGQQTVFVSDPSKTIASFACVWTGGTTTLDYEYLGLMEGVKTVDDFKAYQINTYTLSLPSTCYGGSGDVCKANGISNKYVRYDMGSLNWTYLSTQNEFYVENTTLKINGEVLCEIYDKTDLKYTLMPDKSITTNIENFGTRATIIVKDTSYTSANDFITAVTGKYLIVELDTPTQLTTSALSIPTLSGTNNIYANCGDVDVEYFNENADEIFELISVYPYEVSGVLTAGQTSITLSSGLIKADSTIDVYTDGDVDYNSVSVSSGSITITFDEQASNLGVKVRVS